MFQASNRRAVVSAGWGLVLALLGSSAAPIAPAPDGQDPANPAEASVRAKIRADAGSKAFDTAWLYYSENRIPIDDVYRWSRRLHEADVDAADGPDGRVAAARRHLERMQRLGTKIGRVRQIGFGNSLDVVGTEFYVREAEYWVARAEARPAP